MRKLKSNCQELRDCQRGATILEFAFALPVLLLLIMALIEFSMLWTVNTMFDGGVRQAARYGLTGYAPAGWSREQAISYLIAKNTLGLVDMSKVEISTLVYPSFDQIGAPEPYDDENLNGEYDTGEPYLDVNGNGQWDPDMGLSSTGGPNDVVLYTAEYDWSLLTPFMVNLIGEDGKFPLKSTVALRNEPWNNL